MSISSLHALLIPLGTPGDVQPFIDIGAALLARGHRVTLFAHEPFRARLLPGMEFHPIGTTEDYNRLLNNRHLWQPRHAHRVFARRLVIPTMRPMVEGIRQRLGSNVVVLAQSMSLGARIAQDRFGVKTLTIHRQPSFLRTMHETAAGTHLAIPMITPHFLRRARFRMMDYFLDEPYLPAINALGSELGLAPIRRWANEWLHSPDGIIGVWNDWFAPLQPDWPANVSLCGFIASETAEREPDDSLRAFVEAGSPPIVFTFGSGNRFSRQLLKQSAIAARFLGRRAILLARTETADAPRSQNLFRATYAPFTWLLPRCAAIVHHGGIGTVGAGLAAGIPQFIASGLVFDTLDHAIRLTRLGVADHLPAWRYRSNTVAKRLSALLNDMQVSSRASQLAASVRKADSLDLICRKAAQLVHLPDVRFPSHLSRQSGSPCAQKNGGVPGSE